MTPATSSMPKERNFRQTVEGMPLIFNSAAAGDLKAVIQFNASGKEPGQYYLTIDSGRCNFQKGTASAPSLTINTPSEVWLQVGNGEISGQDALFKGLYKTEGDAAILLRMGELFQTPEDFTVIDGSEPVAGRLFSVFNCSADKDSPSGKRPAGPLPISGMGWMTVFFTIWTIFWIAFDIRGFNSWIGSAVPLALMTVVIAYRAIYNRPVWTEIASWAFFLLAMILAPLLQLPVFLTWGSITGSLFMAGMWLVSLAPFIQLPFCAEYSKWGFVRKLWGNSMFIHPNVAISLVWGWQFIIAAVFGIAARYYPPLFIPFTAIRYLLIIPAGIFTTRYQKGVMERKFADIDKAISSLRAWAYAGLAVAIAMLALLWLVLPNPA
jgi:putative sterol carrier protein